MPNNASNEIDPKKVFLVVWMDDATPYSLIVTAENEDDAWDKVCSKNPFSSDDVYLEHAKNLDELSRESGVSLTALLR